MAYQVFLSYRSQGLASWHAAFPEARVVDSSSSLEPSGTPATLFWLHLKRVDQEACRRIGELRAAHPQCPVIVLANVPEVEEGLAALEAGAAGYLHALSPADLLKQVALVVENGGLWVGEDILRRFLSRLSRNASPPGEPDRLKALRPRERQVALAVARGASNKEIARQLDITERTVKAHLSAIFERLEVRDRLQLSLLINGPPGSSRD